MNCKDCNNRYKNVILHYFTRIRGSFHSNGKVIIYLPIDYNSNTINDVL